MQHLHRLQCTALGQRLDTNDTTCQDSTVSDPDKSGHLVQTRPQTSLFRTPWTCQVWRVVIFRVPFAKFWQMSLFGQARMEIASLRTILRYSKIKKWHWCALLQIWIRLGVSNQCSENFKPGTSMAIHCSGVQYPPGKRTPHKGGEIWNHKQNPVQVRTLPVKQSKCEKIR